MYVFQDILKPVMKYEDLLRRVSESPVLKTAIENMAQYGGVVNLADNNWEKILMNNITYQDFQNGKIPFGDMQPRTYVKMQWLKGYNASFTVLVVGSFYLNKTNDDCAHITCQECPPLDKIYSAMMRSNSEATHPHKFGIPPCNKSFCSACLLISKKCQDKNIPLKNLWCIRKNKIFDGECIKNLLETNVNQEFGKSPFLAIASLRIRGRYFYGENFQQSKLFGDVEDLILFQEHALYDTEINVDFPEESPSLLENKEEEQSTKDTPNDVVPKSVKRMLDVLYDTEVPEESLSLLENKEEDGMQSTTKNRPIDAVPRGVKRMFDEEEEAYKWKVDWKIIK